MFVCRWRTGIHLVSLPVRVSINSLPLREWLTELTGDPAGNKSLLTIWWISEGLIDEQRQQNPPVSTAVRLPSLPLAAAERRFGHHDLEQLRLAVSVDSVDLRWPRASAAGRPPAKVWTNVLVFFFNQSFNNTLSRMSQGQSINQLF